MIASIIPEAVALTFMHFVRVEHAEFGRIMATRCGYTGEDGFGECLYQRTRLRRLPKSCCRMHA